MQDIYAHVTSVLQAESRYAADGKRFRSKLLKAALKPDAALLRLLKNDAKTRQLFFSETDGILIFDKIRFQQFISNKQFLPDHYTRFRNRIGLTAGEEYLTEAKEVVLSFPYKDCVLEGGQTRKEEGRQEVFWNKTLSFDEIDRLFEPKVLTAWKRISQDGIRPASSYTPGSNLLISGNNLPALHSLRQVYQNKVKLIYIDPPYNTGDDSFRYNDRFTHATWLTFMMNRLEVARELLRNTGMIVIQIDNNEAAYLKVLCDEVFGAANYRNTIIVKKGRKSLQKQFARIQRLNAGYDSLLLYTKSDRIKIPHLFKNLDGPSAPAWNNHWRGTDRPTMRYPLFGITPKNGQWRWERNRTYRAVANFEALCDFIRKCTVPGTIITDVLLDEYYPKYLEAGNIHSFSDFELVRPGKKGRPEHYVPPRTRVLLSENWMDLSVAGRVTRFEHEKNEEILRRLIEWLTVPGDTVLDFFLGSGTTAAVAHKLNRHYIGIEQMDYGEMSASQRILKVIRGAESGISKAVKWPGGGECFTCELQPLNASLLQAVGQATENTIDALAIQFMAQPYAHRQLDTQKYREELRQFTGLDLEAKKDALRAMIDYNQLYVSLGDLENKDLRIKEADKKLNRLFYGGKN